MHRQTISPAAPRLDVSSLATLCSLWVLEQAKHISYAKYSDSNSPENFDLFLTTAMRNRNPDRA